MYRRYYYYSVLVAVLCLHSCFVADALKCTEEELMYAPGKSSRFCVYRGVLWSRGTPEPVFEETTAVQVAFVDSNLTAIPESFYVRFPRLDIFVANNVSLEQLKIKDGMKVVYAERNRINQVEVDVGHSLLQLYLKDNPLPSIGDIANSKSLMVLDVSESKIAESSDNTVDFKTFAKMDNLTALYLSNLEAYYFENEAEIALPSLKLLDLSRNPIIPSNFHLRVFRGMPNLEELSLLDTMMSELSVRNIRDELPALKRINIAGNNFFCSFLKTLLAHLRERNVEVIDPSGTSPVNCKVGYDKIDGLCCKLDSIAYPTPPPTPEKPTTPTHTGAIPDEDPRKPYPAPPPTPEKPTTPTHTGAIPDEDPQKPARGSETGEESSSFTTIIIVSVVAVLVLLAVAVFVAMYLKRRAEATHRAVPRNDPNENL